MTNKLAILVFLLIQTVCLGAQEAPVRQSLLWEITGPDLDGKSYLFGSAHLNDSRLFEFDDSLYYALSTCEQFATEVNFDEIDGLLNEYLEKEITEQQAKDEKANGGELDESGFEKIFDGMDINGKSTILDLYLCKAAKQLGMSNYGLEDPDAQLDLFDDITRNEDYYFGTIKYEKFIDNYLKGDISALQKIIDAEDSEDLRMYERNEIQMNSFVELAKKAPTFAVVGAAHLFGRNSVLELLASKSYKVKRLQIGKPDNKIHQLYDQEIKKDWSTIGSNLVGVNLQSPSDNKLVEISGQGELHMATEFEQGLIYMSILFPNSIPLSEVDILESLESELFPDSLFVRNGPILKDETVTYTYGSQSNINSYKAKFVKTQKVTVMQIVHGISKTSMISNSVDRYLNGLEFTKTPNVVWETQESEEGAFSYMFPENISFIKNQIKHPDFPERNNVLIKYKSFTDQESGDQFLVKFNTNPHGVMMTQPHANFKLMFDELAIPFKIDLGDISYFNHGNLLGADISGVNSVGTNYFFRSIIRGSQVYTLMQLTKDSIRNSDFFDSLKLKQVDNHETKEFNYSDAGFTMEVPDSFYFYKQINDEGSLVLNYDYNYEKSGAYLGVEITPISNYTELVLDDTTFNYKNFVDTSVFDSLHYYEKYMYEDTCPGYILQYSNDSTYLKKTEFGIYCNQHKITFEIMQPADFIADEFAKDVINTIKYQLDELSFESLVKDKRSLILSNLQSDDSLTFNLALAAFDERVDFEDEHLPIMFDLLERKLYNHDSIYNAQYSIITELHSFESEQVEDKLIAHFKSTDKEANRSRIIESFIARESDSSVEKLLVLMDHSQSNDIIPEDVYDKFKDSLDLFRLHYGSLKDLNDDGKAVEPFLNLVTSYIQLDAVYSFLRADSLYYSNLMKSHIEQFYINLAQDSSLSISTFIMDYLIGVDMGEMEEDLYATLIGAKDVYGKYRTYYNKIIRGDDIPKTLIDDIMVDDYYRYYVQLNHHEFGRVLPSEYQIKEDIGSIIMKKYIGENYDYDCKSCELINTLSLAESSIGNMLVFQCDAGEEGKYYIGCVGPFDEEGNFDYDNDQSLYYNTIQDGGEYQKYKEEFIKYYNEKE